MNEDLRCAQLAEAARAAFRLDDDAEIGEAVEQIETAFHRALLFVPLDEAPSTAKQRKILVKLTPEDFRSGNPIDE